MLQQILERMYIDPEILAELSEDQKQILYIKMRQEQVRRWKLNEEKLDAEERLKPKPESGKRHITFLQGKDGCDWVWVMGDHRDDVTVENILQKEAQEKARQLAEKEADAIRIKEEAELAKRMEEERLKVIKENEEKEAELKRKQEEAAIYQSMRDARLAFERLEIEKENLLREEKKKMSAIEEEGKRAKRRSMEFSHNLQIKRSGEIYSTLQKRREHFEQLAEEGQKDVESNWKAQEKKAVAADKEKRETAFKARQDYNESIRRSFSIIQAVQAISGGGSSASSKPPLPPKKHLIVTSAPSKANQKPRPLRPKGKDMVVNWFKKEEVPRGAGKESDGSIAEWFHGIVNRQESERLLEDKPAGCFLIRVSERVWGYTLSFKEANRIKHFLIDASDHGYQFIGASQTIHESLNELIAMHMQEPITLSGQEKLQSHCGQDADPPDYWELFHGNETEVTSL